MRQTSKLTGCAAILLALSAAGWDEPPDQGSKPREREMSSYGVARRGTATVEDAYRQFLTMAVNQGRINVSGEVDDMSFEQVTSYLADLCIIDPAWCYGPNSCLRRDVLAYMSCSYLGCRPGLITGMFGMTRRYAHREMLYQRIIPPGAPATLVSGSELLSVATGVNRRVEQRRDVQLTADEIH